jgi:predicted secreted protein
MTTLADIGHSSRFEIVSDSSPDLYVALDEVRNITPPTLTLDTVDVTHMQSPNRYRERISGLIDPGEASCEINYVPGGTTDDRLRELLNLPAGTTRSRAMRISFPNGATMSFTAEVSSYEPTVPVDDAMTATVNFLVSGQPTMGTT